MKKKGRLLVVVFLVTATQSFAAELDIRVDANSLQTDNALRAANGEEGISERQDVYGVQLLLEHSGDRINLSADYDVEYNVFSESSQQDRETKNGQSELKFGNSTDILNLSLGHSVRSVLSDPAALPLLDNLVERSISYVQPNLNFRFSSVDTLILAASRHDITYSVTSAGQFSIDSTRSGLNAQWNHSLDQVASMGVAISTEDVEFKNAAANDYTVEYFELTYSASLRKLKYSIAVGQSRSILEDDTTSGDRFRFSLDYAYLSSIFGLAASRTLTDSSRGDDNQLAVSAEGNFESGGGHSDIDQIQLTTADLFWTSKLPCSRCSFRLATNYQDEEYLHQSELDNTMENVSLILGYHANERNSVDIRSVFSKRQFSSTPLQDYEQEQLSITYNYLFSKNLSLRAAANKRTRKLANLTSDKIEENQIGLGVNYRF